MKDFKSQNLHRWSPKVHQQPRLKNVIHNSTPYQIREKFLLKWIAKYSAIVVTYELSLILSGHNKTCTIDVANFCFGVFLILKVWYMAYSLLKLNKTLTYGDPPWGFPSKRHSEVFCCCLPFQILTKANPPQLLSSDEIRLVWTIQAMAMPFLQGK